MARSNFSGAWQRSTGEGQRCMLRIMWVTRALESMLYIFNCCHVICELCICIIDDTIHIHTYVDGTASPCQAPTGTVDLLSGGEATVTTVTPAPAPAPEATKTVAEAASLCRKWKRFMTLYGCLRQTVIENLINHSYAIYASMQYMQ